MFVSYVCKKKINVEIFVILNVIYNSIFFVFFFEVRFGKININFVKIEKSFNLI